MRRVCANWRRGVCILLAVDDFSLGFLPSYSWRVKEGSSLLLRLPLILLLSRNPQPSAARYSRNLRLRELGVACAQRK